MKNNAVLSSLCASTLLVAAGFLAGSCHQSTADKPSVLVVSNVQTEAWVRNFNPFSSRGDLLWPARGGVYETLQINNVMTGEYEPWLATGHRWDQTDEVLTFDIRPGVRWSDGEPFSARDVVFTFELMREHPLIDHNNIWSYLKEVRADGDLVVSFVFQHTHIPGLEHLVRQPIVPEHVWATIEDPVGTLNPNPVATGPFTEVVRFDDEVYELGRNPHYWQEGEPEVDLLRLPSYRNNSEVLEALLSGEIDWSGNFVPNAETTFQAADPEYRTSWSPLIDGPVFLIPNTTRPPFDEVSVRKALSLAIDRERLVHDAMNGTTRPADATCLDDAKQRYRNDDAVALDNWTTFDPDAAEALLDEAGYLRGDDGRRGPDGGAPWSFEVTVPAGWSDWVQTAEIIAENLSTIGVTASVAPQSVEEWMHDGKRGEFELTIGMTNHRETAYTMYRSLVSTITVRPVGQSAEVNWHRFGDEEADGLLLAYEMTSEDDIQVELIRRVQLRLVEMAPVIPLFFGPSWGTANSRRIDGFPSADNPYARLSPNSEPDCLLVLTKLHPRE